MSLGVHVSSNYHDVATTVVYYCYVCRFAHLFLFFEEAVWFLSPFTFDVARQRTTAKFDCKGPRQFQCRSVCCYVEGFVFCIFLERTTGINYSIGVVDYVFSSAHYTPLINAI